MKRSTFSVIFYLKRQVVKKDGKSPIMGRITVDGSQTQFSCKVTVNPKTWDAKQGRATGRSTATIEVNRMLDKIRGKIQTHYQEILDRDNYVNAEKVKNALLGLEHRQHTFMKVYEQFLDDYEKQTKTGMKSPKTLNKYDCVFRHLKAFLQHRYKITDIALKELTPAFITDFDMYLRVERGCCNNSIWVYTSTLRTMVYIAMNNGWLLKDPFREYVPLKDETEREFFTKEEINMLITGKLKNKKQEYYRDMFLFCTFTGLSFADMKNLSEDNIRNYFDDNLWIHIQRQKTGVESNIRLLDIPKRIIEKYRGTGKDGKIFDVPLYTTCLYGIRQVAKRCGITKHFGWHSSRHSAATTVLLSNGVPIETVSSILGHKNITTTQVYAKITKEKVNRDMENLSMNLANIAEYNAASIL